MTNGTSSAPRPPSYTVGRPRSGPRAVSPAALAAEYYKTYDVMTGVRIAATLGGIVTFFGLFLLYKSRCRAPLKALTPLPLQLTTRHIDEPLPRQETLEIKGRAVRCVVTDTEPHCSTSVVVVERHSPPRSFSPQGIPFISSSSSSCSEESTGSKSARAQLTLPLASPCSVPSIVVLPKDSKTVSIVALTPARPVMTRQMSEEVGRRSLRYKDTRGDSAETRYSSSSGSRSHVRDSCSSTASLERYPAIAGCSKRHTPILPP